MSREALMERIDMQAAALWQSNPSAWADYLATVRPAFWKDLVDNEQSCATLIRSSDDVIQNILKQRFASATGRVPPPIAEAVPAFTFRPTGATNSAARASTVTWEEKQSFETFFSTTAAVLMHPYQFFSNLRFGLGKKPPWNFVKIYYVVVFLSIWFSMLANPSIAHELSAELNLNIKPHVMCCIFFLFALLVIWLEALLLSWSFAITGCEHPRGLGYEATLRVLCYTGMIRVAEVLLSFGGESATAAYFLVVIIQIIYEAIGFSAVYNTSWQRVILAYICAFVLLCLIVGAIAVGIFVSLALFNK